MSVGEAFVLLLAGIGAGLTGSVAGLASLISYPVLLAVGLSPVTANVTNTVALVFSSTGSVIGSRPELVGQRERVRQLLAAGVVGGAVGALLLLVTPAGSFERVVPVLIAVASVAILARRRVIDDVVPETPQRVGPGTVIGVGVVGIYGGYFGAGAGVMLLALLLLSTHDTLPRCNGLKNVVIGVANGIAAVGFALFGPVRWNVVLPLGCGLLVGARVGPIIVRRSPAGVLRAVIACAGLGLAVKLGFDAYG